MGEYIEIAGVSGQVKQIGINFDNAAAFDMSHVMVPSRKLVGEILHNTDISGSLI